MHATNLIARGVRRKDGNIFEQKHLYTILHNSSYTGKTTLQGTVYDNIIPQIITDKLWAVVETINNENKIAPSRKKAIFDYILTGKLVCGNCHKLMSCESGTSHTGDIHYYYVCTARRKKKAKCSTQAIQKQWLEDMVINTTMKMLQKENNIHEIATNLFELHKVEATKITADGTMEIEERSNSVLSSKQSSCLFFEGVPKCTIWRDSEVNGKIYFEKVIFSILHKQSTLMKIKNSRISLAVFL